jgi:hypothetical protein
MGQRTAESSRVDRTAGLPALTTMPLVLALAVRPEVSLVRAWIPTTVTRMPATSARSNERRYESTFDSSCPEPWSARSSVVQPALRLLRKAKRGQVVTTNTRMVAICSGQMEHGLSLRQGIARRLLQSQSLLFSRRLGS